MAGCAGSGSTTAKEKPLVEATNKEYSLDHIEGIEKNLAGEGLQVAKMIGGTNALQKEVNKMVARKECPVRGKVLVVYVVDTSGDVMDAAAASGIHDECDKTAEEAVKKMKFVPATKNGSPVRIRMGTQVSFN